ncbi:MAG: MMPL family transporter [Pirellulales bacterium]
MTQTLPASSFFARHSLKIMAVCLFLLPFAAIGSIRAKSSNKNDVRNWIPKEYEETIVYRDFRELFQGEEFVLVSWDGCNASNKRIEDLALKLLPPVRIDYRGESLPDGHAASDLDTAKLDIETRLRDQRQADAVATGADAPVVKLHYGLWLNRKGQETLCVFENVQDEGDPHNPNREMAYAVVTREPHGYFKGIMTGPRAIRQITTRNAGFAEEAAIEGLAGALYAPGTVLRRGAKLMVDDHPLPFNGAKIEIQDGYVQVDGANLNDKGRPVLANGRTIWVDAVPVHKFDGENRPLDPATGAVLKPDEVCHVGMSLRQTCVVVTMSADGLKDKKAAVDKLRTVAIDECSIPADKLHIGGPPVDNVAIDNAGNKSLNILAGVAVVIGFIVSWFSLRSVKLVLIVITAGIYASILSLSIVWWTGAPVDAILFTMPSLVYVATTSGAIHLSNYYRDVRLEGHPASGAGGAALHHAAVPLSLATGTTAVGLATLCYTELVPIYYFGLYSAIGVLVSAAVVGVLHSGRARTLEAGPRQSRVGYAGRGERNPHARQGFRLLLERRPMGDAAQQESFVRLLRGDGAGRLRSDLRRNLGPTDAVAFAARADFDGLRVS